MKKKQSKLPGEWIERKRILLQVAQIRYEGNGISVTCTEYHISSKKKKKKSQAFSLKSWDLTWFSVLSISLAMQ